MKIIVSFVRRPAALASLLLALVAPATSYSAEQFAATHRATAPVGTRIQQVDYNSCPSGNCNTGGGRGWGGGWGGGRCQTCNGGGLFGCGCHHGTAGGYAFVRPPATWPLARTSNTYNYYWNAQLAGAPAGSMQPGLQYPMVYQPTDTTQMGFYYQAVPRWQYRPEMLPAAPSPYWPMGSNGGYGGGCPSGNCWNGPTNGTYNTAPQNMTPVTPAPAQQAPVVAPPPPTDPQVNVPEPDTTYFPSRIRR